MVECLIIEGQREIQKPFFVNSEKPCQGNSHKFGKIMKKVY